MLLRGTFPDEIADHDNAGGDADANLELADSHVEPSDCGDDVEAGAHGPLGIVFVGARKAEINQHAVAHVFRDETVEAANHLGHAAVIGADHLAQLFGIEPRRQRRRADEVAEHHRQLPPFGLRLGRRTGSLRRLFVSRRGRGALAQRRDRFEEPAAIADHGDADLLEILPGQLGEYLGVDAVVAKRRLVLLEPQAPQPRRDLHAALPDVEPIWCSETSIYHIMSSARRPRR